MGNVSARDANMLEFKVITLCQCNLIQSRQLLEGNICILSLKRIQQCNQVFTCQQFQRYQDTQPKRTLPQLTNT